MSLFRKPKKIQRRVFCADDDEDGDEPEPPPPPLISQKRDKKENKSVKAPKLLSFADEEEECEEFKVKKSSQSKRLAKRREKERKKTTEYDNDDADAFHKDIEFPEEKNANHTTKEEKKKKKVTLEGLILSGRAALAAEGRGDVSGSSEEEGGGGFHRYRADSVRAALAVPGHIPDAALIHAARKTRQQARELGEFVPLGAEGGAGEGRREGEGRLVREGEGDDSADDDEGRIIVRGLELPTDKPQRGTAAVQSEEEECTSEGERWEAQQLRAALPDPELNPFAAPPPPPPPAAPRHLRPLHPPPASAGALLAAWAGRLAELRGERAALAARRAVAAARLRAAAARRVAGAGRTRALDAAYRRAQEMRGYVTDLVECLDEKLPALRALEGRALALARRRTDFLLERRRADLHDQAQDVLALAARSGATRAADSEEKVRRTAEREGRRRARRLRREGAGAAHAHRDGDSSDDTLPPDEEHHIKTETESIRAASAALFADALPAWRSVRGVAARLGRWRRRAPHAYVEAHAPHAAPRLLAPYVRHQLILWNPLADEDNEDYEKMDWFKCLMMYGVQGARAAEDSPSSSEGEGEGAGAGAERAVAGDVDLMLLPTILNKVLLPKITELVEETWDPMCVRACVRLRGVLVRACAVPRAAPALRALARAACARLAAARARLLLPALPPALAEGAPAAFWRRCLGAAVRLLRGTLALTAPPRPLHAEPAVLALIDTLCAAAAAAPGPLGALAAAALAETLPRAGPLRARALRRLALLAARAQGACLPAPLHLKAIEQCRAVIAEAKAAEARAAD